MPWDEAVDWEFDVPDVALGPQIGLVREVTFELPAVEEIELVDEDVRFSLPTELNRASAQLTTISTQ